MEMIKIPHTDLEVSRLALGCMGLGGGWEADVKLTKDHERQAREFLDTAEDTTLRRRASRRVRGEWFPHDVESSLDAQDNNVA
jgi:hypothetical protein